MSEGDRAMRRWLDHLCLAVMVVVIALIMRGTQTAAPAPEAAASAMPTAAPSVTSAVKTAQLWAISGQGSTSHIVVVVFRSDKPTVLQAFQFPDRCTWEVKNFAFDHETPRGELTPAECRTLYKQLSATRAARKPRPPSYHNIVLVRHGKTEAQISWTNSGRLCFQSREDPMEIFTPSSCQKIA